MELNQPEVTDMEAKWSQGMALGLTNARPQLHRQERGRDLNGLVLGYDLPKIYLDGKEVKGFGLFRARFQTFFKEQFFQRKRTLPTSPCGSL